MTPYLLLCSALFVETGAEVVQKKEEIRAYWARKDEEQMAKLPCADRMRYGLLRACQNAVLSGADPHVTSGYVYDYCSGAADLFVLTSRIDWPILPEAEPLECPADKAKETGSQLGSQLKARLLSRW